MSDDDFDFSALLEGVVADKPSPPPAPQEEPAAVPEEAVSRQPSAEVSFGVDLETFQNDAIYSRETAREAVASAANETKAWMKFHKFVLVQTVKEFEDLVDKAIQRGRCAIDLEAEGFDNRIDYDELGRPYTRHKIVGICLAMNGIGYYTPIRHRYDKSMEDKSPNVEPVEKVEAALKRLCLASQPELTEEGFREDRWASKKFARPPRVILAFFNAKYDQELLFPVTGIDWWHPDSFEDGLLATYCIHSDDNAKNLKDKAEQLLSVTDPETGEVHSYEMIEFKNMFGKEVPPTERRIYNLSPDIGSIVTKYGCSDAICTELLCDPNPEVDWAITPKVFKFKHLVKEAKEKHGGTYRLEKMVTQAIRFLERHRTLINKNEIQVLLEEVEVELTRIDEKISLLARAKGFHNFNPSSSQQVGEFLFGEKGLNITPKPALTATGLYKTDAASLERLADETGSETLNMIVERRKVEKVKGTYLEKMANNTDEHGRLRFNFNQTGAATGRFTAPQGDADHGFAGIPIQGIPVKQDPTAPRVLQSLRRIFVAHPGYTLLKVDYAGEELRIAANISGEQVWIKEFLEGDGDLHKITAIAFWPGLKKTDKDFKDKRKKGKTANFALVYGGGTAAVQRATQCQKEEAARMKANFDRAVPKFTGWGKGQHESVKRDLGVKTAFARWIAIPDANITPQQVNEQRRLKGEEPLPDKKAWQEAKKIRAGCERKSTNFPIQGAAADIIKISLVRVYKELMNRGWTRNGGDDSVRMLMTIHDEIVFEIKHDRLQEATPVIVDIMEFPATMPKSPVWQVPLIADATIGLNWAAEIPWIGIMNGKDVDGKPVAVPDWLQGIVVPCPIEPKVQQPKALPELVITEAQKQELGQAMAAEVQEQKEVGAAVQLSTPVSQLPEPKPEPAFVPSPEPAEKKVFEKKGVVFSISHTLLLRSNSVEVVRIACKNSLCQDGPALQLTDDSGNVLIPWRLAIRVDPDKLVREMTERNLAAHPKYNYLDPTDLN